MRKILKYIWIIYTILFVVIFINYLTNNDRFSSNNEDSVILIFLCIPIFAPYFIKLLKYLFKQRGEALSVLEARKANKKDEKVDKGGFLSGWKSAAPPKLICIHCGGRCTKGFLGNYGPCPARGRKFPCVPIKDPTE